MGTATREAYKRHYNERVPTIEEEFEVWGRYHQHRHEKGGPDDDSVGRAQQGQRYSPRT